MQEMYTMALSETEKDLIVILKGLGKDEEFTIAITDLLETEENQSMMIAFLINRYRAKGKVTNEEIAKVLMKITVGVPKKESSEKEQE